jgi:hypothetical protein
MGQLDLEINVMAIREMLMEYFKGTCVRRVTDNHNVTLQSIQKSSNYYFERRENEIKNPVLLYVSNVPILTLSKEPETLTLHLGTLERSKELREVRIELEKFMHDYLRGVRIEVNNANSI